MKKWRATNPEKMKEYRDRWEKKYPKKRKASTKKGNKKYYAKFAGPGKNLNHNQIWTTGDIILITVGKFTDRELHKLIGRSVAAIQKMRWRMKK